MGDVATDHLPRSVAFLGNHTHRQCGIATFTADEEAAARFTTLAFGLSH